MGSLGEEHLPRQSLGLGKDTHRDPPLLQPLLEHEREGHDASLTGWPAPSVFLGEAKHQMVLGLPVAGLNILNFLMSLVSIIFVGRLGELPLAAAAMAATLANVLGFAILVNCWL